MIKPYYVTLTGSRNNAGDFLIRYRGHNLLRKIRPDRELVDMNSWEPLTDEQIEVINQSEALILLGGPALRKDMYPVVYPLVDDLSRIKVPITIMGAGWKAMPGYWVESHSYVFTPKTKLLLERIAQQNIGISVRDYRSLNSLFVAGISNAVMTGCPALYDPEKLGTNFILTKKSDVKTIVYSYGVNFVESKSIKENQREVLLAIVNQFPEAKVVAAFHHSVNEDELTASYGKRPKFANAHREEIKWLHHEGIAMQDISGGVEDLIDLYTLADLHIGYRVHAHIFMSSIRKPSVLISEDGRGRGLKEVLGGLVFDSFTAVQVDLTDRVLNKVGIKKMDAFQTDDKLADDIVNFLEYDFAQGNVITKQIQTSIDRHFSVMKTYLERLP